MELRLGVHRVLVVEGLTYVEVGVASGGLQFSKIKLEWGLASISRQAWR